MTTAVFDKNAVNATNIVDYIADVFDRRGTESYLGEEVSMAQHMLQAAQQAEMSQAEPELVVAALLHDIGHYSNEIPDHVLMQGTNNYHEEAGANFLADYFPLSVTEPIRQHVATKRYLCATDPEYYSRLSEASVYTLKVQGGPMSRDEVAEFEKSPYLELCIKVRIWDDRGKDPEKPHPDFSHYREILQSLVQHAE
jgi:phosphonate degradation associated HDIG domain protein